VALLQRSREVGCAGVDAAIVVNDRVSMSSEVLMRLACAAGFVIMSCYSVAKVQPSYA
jgi:hypothetical protein